MKFSLCIPMYNESSIIAKTAKELSAYMGEHFGDDYEIICWDFVGDPSTNNAWVDMDKEKLTPYLENTEKKSNIINENNKKFDKFTVWLNDLY